MHLGRELGEIINEQQDIILKLQNENRRLKRENWNLKHNRGRRK
nr:MAG TPA: Protein HEXIM1 T-binding domain (TBD), Cyclin.1A [Caudoviricetes sp.]